MANLIIRAMKVIQKVKSDKFEESVDISIKLGVDPNKSDQNVRGAVTLPNSLGKDVTVAVFADGDDIKIAEIFSALDEKVKTMACKKDIKKSCTGKLIKCITHNLWDELDLHINAFFENKKLEDLIRN